MTGLYVLVDIKLKNYGQVQTSPDIDVIKRSLSYAVNKPSDSTLFNFPEDFDLYKVGTIDEKTGVITPCKELEFNCAELKKTNA